MPQQIDLGQFIWPDAGQGRLPQGPLQIAPQWLALGITHVWVWSGGKLPPNSVTGARLLTDGNSDLTTVLGVAGIGLSTPTTSSRAEVTGNPLGTSTCSYIWAESLGPDSGNSANGGAIVDTRWAATAVPNNGALQIRKSGSDILVLRAQQAVLLTASGVRSDSRFNVGALSVAGNNGRIAVFARGGLAASASPTNTFVHGTSAIGGSYPGDNLALNGPLYLLAFAPVVIPDAALAYITANPSELFVTPTLGFYGPAANADNLLGQACL